jgi:hypothetical protein
MFFSIIITIEDIIEIDILKKISIIKKYLVKNK